MKRTLLIAGAAFSMATGTTQAGLPPHLSTLRLNDGPARIPQQLPTTMVEVPALSTPQTSKVEQTQALTMTALYAADFPFGDNVSSNQTFIYDPGTKDLLLLRPTRVFNEAFTELLGGQYFFVTKDLTATQWTQTEIMKLTGTYFTSPNIGLYLRPGTTNIADADYVMYGFNYIKNGTDFNFDAATSWVRSGGSTFDIPRNGGPGADGYTWSSTDLVSWGGTEQPSITFVSRLGSPASRQYGAYGAMTYDFAADDFVAELEVLPDAWKADKFVQPAGNLAVTYGSDILVRADAEGVLYAAVSNPFIEDNDFLKRRVGVSKSEDGGATWSGFEKLPLSVIETYRTQRGWNNVSEFGAFTESDFVVLGPDEYSYFYRLCQTNDQGNAINIDLVEASFKNGIWSLAQITELADIPLVFDRQDSISQLAGENAWVLSGQANPRGHEIDVAVTEDGNNIVVKWIDGNIDLGFQKFAQSLPVYFQDRTTGRWNQNLLDSMLAVDIFVASRSRATSAWSAPVNLTNDTKGDVGTLMPRIVPSTTNIPLISHRMRPLADLPDTYRFKAALAALPAQGYEQQLNGLCIVYSSTASLVVSVDEDVTPAPMVNTIAPNPSVNGSELSFVLERGGNVSVTLHDMLGNTVRTISSGVLSAGLHGATIRTDDLASGAYMVAITANGSTTTAPLTVIH